MTPEAITEVRHRLGLSQTRLANWMGVHRVTVAKWETGEKKPSGPVVRLYEILAVGRIPKRMRATTTKGT